MNRSQRWTLVATVLASATVFLDSTIVNVALPRIGRDLPHSLVGVLEGQDPFPTSAEDVIGWLADHYREHVQQCPELVADWRKTLKEI